jgi:hypothetical protein
VHHSLLQIVMDADHGVRFNSDSFMFLLSVPFCVSQRRKSGSERNAR